MTTQQPPAGTRFPSIEDITPAAVARPPADRPRWLLPLAALVGVAGILAFAGLVVFSGLLSGAPAATRSGYQYVPDTAIAAAEIRLDMPSGQQEQVVTFLQRMPDFAGQDQAQVEARLTELLDEAVQTATAGRGGYATDVEPWFSGWIVVAGTAEDVALPGMGITPLLPDADSTFVLAVLGSTDRAAAEAALLKLRPAGEWASTDVSGATLWTWNDPRPGSHGAPYAVTDDAVLFAESEGDLRLALDTRAGTLPSLLEKAAFADAWNALPAARLAAVWMDTAAVVELSGEFVAGAPIETCDALPQPTSATGVLYVRDGRAVAEFSTRSPADGASPAPNRDSGLDYRLPADTFFYAHGNELGATIGGAIECARDNPDLADMLRDLEQRVGGLDDMTAWIGDTGIAARYDGTRASVGLVVKVTDQTRAAEAMGQLRTALIGLGEGVTVAEEDYAGTRVVTISFGGLPSPPPMPNMALSYAFDGDLLIVGLDGSFTRAVLDATDATSLRSNATYRAAMESAGGYANGGGFYLDIAAAGDLWERLLPAESIPDDVGEYLEAFDTAVMVVSVNGQTATTRFVLSTAAE